MISCDTVQHLRTKTMTFLGISISSISSIDIFWNNSSVLWTAVLQYYFFCLIKFSRFCLCWIIMTTIFASFFQPGIPCVNGDSDVLLYAMLLIVKIFILGSSSMMYSILSTGQEISLYRRNFGPLNHLEENALLFASSPREVSWADFNLEGSYLHSLNCFSSCILTTNILKFLAL